jgi:hypothetical protein
VTMRIFAASAGVKTTSTSQATALLLLALA